MITLSAIGKISPIFLTVLLIIYLILAELGNKKIKESLIPLITALMMVFLIILILDIISKF